MRACDKQHVMFYSKDFYGGRKTGEKTENKSLGKGENNTSIKLELYVASAEIGLATQPVVLLDLMKGECCPILHCPCNPMDVCVLLALA